MVKNYSIGLLILVGLAIIALPAFTSTTKKSSAAGKLSVQAAALNTEQIATLFNGRGKRFVSKKHPVYPIKICITNNTSSTWSISPEQIGMDILSPKTVYDRTKKSTAQRVFGSIAAGLAITGITAIAIGALVFLCSNGSGILSAFLHGILGGGATTIIGTGTTAGLTARFGRKSTESNSQLLEEINKSVLTEQLHITPGSKVEKLIFVHQKNWRDQFDVILKNDFGEEDRVRAVVC